ncbi:hypothetical protein GCM10022197_40500 [Microlunatus spumicola]|uniref:Uncharacterized protein n=1 Tax=Microlunatus spumicola TaxID=81499 RepID=A0ABP6Y984_9ACTN
MPPESRPGDGRDAQEPTLGTNGTRPPEDPPVSGTRTDDPPAPAHDVESAPTAGGEGESDR